jgi:hypothetical protein
MNHHMQMNDNTTWLMRYPALLAILCFNLIGFFRHLFFNIFFHLCLHFLLAFFFCDSPIIFTSVSSLYRILYIYINQIPSPLPSSSSPPSSRPLSFPIKEILTSIVFHLCRFALYPSILAARRVYLYFIC